ncbi:MAG TPA: phosphatidylserine decarboxylase [Phycisphaerales bacterium]|nr:phosphatidylserine decarboxylase [Phycisphaerales bacterium]HMP35973.1 phosphatidylserine decarboxylase [Phycisphaerales bacterium]
MLTPYGDREWSVALLIGGAAAIAAWSIVGVLGVLLVAAAVLAALAFFRDPPRAVPVGLSAGAMLSPADGRVSKIFDVEHHVATEGPARIVRIFLSVLDVHVNRAPCDGTVVAVVHAPGRYLDARTEESARVNESNLMIMRLRDGRRVGVRQVSGAIARRIVCAIAPGGTIGRGERYGMIKFGSTTELILPSPESVTLRVSEGDVVRGGVTLLAELAPVTEEDGSPAPAPAPPRA